MKQYFQYTRSPWYSYLFALPLLALYQVVVLLANLGERRQVINGADALVQSLLGNIGIHGWLLSGVAVAVIAGAIAYHIDAAHRKGAVRKEYFGLMLAESAAYALVLGSIAAFLTSLILPGGAFLQIGGGSLSFKQQLAAGLGAGLYEELVFRLGLTGGLIWALRKLQWKPGAVIVVAVLASSFVFSLFHYVGPYGEALQLTSFTFRFVAGVLLAALYSARGFAVAAWT
ncbi:MAG TPA: CPBP family intramembrane glutamic endopeptidase, partial [Armatimonadota bacterium]|nr:CPBP family intramembrane glutamic endopeptidase [Armatimonadota bacterium]